MITVKKTENGNTQEITFDTTIEAARALGSLFNVELSESVRRQEERQALNNALRQEWRRGSGVSTDDVQKLLDETRRRL